MTRPKAPPTAATMAVRTALILAIFVVAFSGLLVAAFPFHALGHEQHDGGIVMHGGGGVAGHPGDLDPR